MINDWQVKVQRSNLTSCSLISFNKSIRMVSNDPQNQQEKDWNSRNSITNNTLVLIVQSISSKFKVHIVHLSLKFHLNIIQCKTIVIYPTIHLYIMIPKHLRKWIKLLKLKTNIKLKSNFNLLMDSRI